MELNKANRQVSNVDIRTLKREPFLYLDSANTTTAGLTGDNTYAMKRGVKAVNFPNPLEGTMTIEAQVYPFKIFSLLSDGTIESNAVIAKKATIKATEAGKITVPTGASSVFVFAAGDFGGTQLKGELADTVWTATTPADIVSGTSYEVGYMITKDAGVNRIAYNTKKVPKAYYITMDTLDKAEDDTTAVFIMTAYKATPKRSLDISQSSTGDPATLKIEFDLMEDADGNQFDIVEDTSEA